MIKLLRIAGAAALLVGCSRGGQATFQFDGAAALEYARAQMAFGPRVPGTEGHRATGDWILEHLRARADTVEVQAFHHVTAAGDTLPLRNFIARFAPERTDRILLLAHWDTRPVAEKDPNLARQRQPTPGANDGASGVAVLLGVADELHREPPRFGVDLLFVDGEDYGDFGTGVDVFLGSRYFVEHLPEGYAPLFAVLFDMVGDADLEIGKEGYSVEGAPEVVDRVWRTARDLGYRRVFRPDVAYWVQDDHVTLLRAGIRAIDVIDFTYGPNNRYHHSSEDTIDKLSAESLDIVGTVAVALVR